MTTTPASSLPGPIHLFAVIEALSLLAVTPIGSAINGVAVVTPATDRDNEDTK